MGLDDANDNGPRECPGHHWVPMTVQIVKRDGLTGMSIVNECKWCDAVFYEPSNIDLFPDTNGVDPRH